MSHINKNNCVILNKLKVNIEKSLNLKLYDKKKKIHSVYSEIITQLTLSNGSMT